MMTEYDHTYQEEIETPITSAVPASVLETVHDLNNLVSTFSVRLHLAKRKQQQRPECLDGIEQLIGDLEKLTNQLKTQIHSQTVRVPRSVQQCDLYEIVQQVVAVYRPMLQLKGITLLVEHSQSLPTIWANETEIKRVVTNIVSNAIKYTPRKGSIHLTISQEEDSILFTTSDTGIGIRPEALPYIFERYYRTDEAKNAASGSGLGLAIVSKIVKKYGGTIEVKSTVGKGSIFTISLPAKGLVS